MELVHCQGQENELILLHMPANGMVAAMVSTRCELDFVHPQ